MLFYNYCSVKAYGARYRAVCLKHPINISPGEARIGGKRGSADTEERFAQSISRTRVRVFEIAACNPFEWFGTFTLDKEKYDRFNLSKFCKDFTQFLRDERKRTGFAVHYLLIPERHQDGAWHMHGLFFGIPEADLVEFGEGAPKKLREGGYMNWPRYARKFGFVSLGRIRDNGAVAAYVTKYIAKGIEARECEKDVHLYYASRGLNRAQVVARGEIADSTRYAWTWEGDHTSRLEAKDGADVVGVVAELDIWALSKDWKARYLDGETP